MVRVEHLHQGRDGRGSGGVDDDGTGHVLEVGGGRGRDRHGLHVRGVTSRGAHETVLPSGQHGLELLGSGTAHGPGRGLHDHVLQPETVEDADVGVPEGLVAGLQARVVDVEGVGILHDELASPEQTGAGAGLVAVFRLDLEEHQGQVLVGAVQVTHQKGEHLLVGGAEQHVIATAVLQPEQVLPVLGPAVGGLVGIPGQQGGEPHLLGPCGLHLLTENALDLLHHLQTQRQPRVHPRCDATDVSCPNQPPVAGDLGIRRVFTQGPNEQLAEARDHRGSFLSETGELYRPVAPIRSCSGATTRTPHQ